MPFDFDLPITRENTHSVKFDGRQQYFGTAGVTPLWVADMDFAVPECITRALANRIEHPVFGYSLYPESLYDAMIDWFARRHQWVIEREWIVMAPGVVPSLFAAVQAFTNPGEGVIVQSPVYFPFFSAVTTHQRRLLNNPLRENQGRYEMDFDHLEQCAQQGAGLLMLCTPHNPVGRVWSVDELMRILDIARRYNLTILSDDIHCDLVYPGYTQTMLGRLAQAGDKIVTTLAPNKSFNIPGLGLSALVIPDPRQRQAMKHVFESLHISNTNPLSIVAFEAAYRGGAAWLEALMDYLAETCRMVANFLAREIPQIRMQVPEATYLLWLDCRQLAMNDNQLRDFFIHECKLGLSPGIVFGEGGSGFMRMNIGTTRAHIYDALVAIRDGIARLP
ncbi:MalY/PatB family protein [Cellvibrio japonicus]|uniref:cysteine-S-conjugate beta-lyase n=1 Tax=Cellvibrio japonicus (strain Ueda107) TaxID=498211 RepID=B3PGP5_CELJU|nr:PatB family C-S lyase [Cellvibrio japonicus]ACE85529.1 Aminotransferases class-I [Cellvibrio japonicus Ueda107]QEI12390.1 putative C-S lyase [Cellvibrio japonicus]QEI15963.1 putative C-S lyase [Cellvibrio japonicus]QEI19542.1 putative C-S lyase [Cellvibrio japonicus]